MPVDGADPAHGRGAEDGGGPAGHLVPAATSRAEQTIRRSRFIAAVGRADDPDTAARFVQAIRGEFPDATHHCWAFVAGPPGSTASVGMSDDREPHGSAGRPMLAVLLHSGIGNVVAVVTRYYGGTNLGVGGLVRAYSSTLQLAVEKLPLSRRVDSADLSVVVDYASVDALRRLVPAFHGAVVDETFGTEVGLRVRLPTERVDGFVRAVSELTGGRGAVLAGGK
jgi:uncharacterized YigZ family protein